MVNYQSGKIYEITGNGYSYYGSTVKVLSQRLSGHVYDYNLYMTWEDMKYVTSFKCFENNNTDYEITLVELFPCNNMDELKVRERYYIELNRDRCVNKQIPGRTRKEYRVDNADNIRAKSLKYTSENREKISANRNKKDKCLCGAIFTHVNILRHKLTQKHIKYFQQSEEDN